MAKRVTVHIIHHQHPSGRKRKAPILHDRHAGGTPRRRSVRRKRLV